jgi:hypothetical protein
MTKASGEVFEVSSQGKGQRKLRGKKKKRTESEERVELKTKK